MSKTGKIVIALAILGIGYWLVSPLFIDKRVSEESPVEAGSAWRRGQFEGFDRIHYGSGGMQLIRTEEGFVVRFNEDFNVANGPALVVGFGKDGVYKPESELGKLKGNIGSQNYLVPDGIDPEDYNEVWVWCKAFGVGFAKARLSALLSD